MAGSEAEERVRAKAVERLRLQHPTGRIIHELQLEQGGVRIDLACVTPDRLVVAEIKSERDTLARLENQVAVALRLADEVWVVVAEHHADAARHLWTPPRYPTRDEIAAGHTTAKWIEESRAFHRRKAAKLFVEFAGSSGLLQHMQPKTESWPEPHGRFSILWAQEMRNAVGLHFGGAPIPVSTTRPFLMRQAIEHMSGREIRRAICYQLRQRPFPRADPATDADG